jgi:hypothetical protein
LLKDQKLEEEAQGKTKDPKLEKAFWISMQITYYNMAVELEHLRQFKKSIVFF